MKTHIEEFIRLTCAVDLLKLAIFPNAKEVTESMGAYASVRNYILPKIDAKLSDSNIAVVVVGDGTTPRTGALFAFRSAWTVYSIDPVMRKLEWPVKRLICQRRKIEDEILNLYEYDQVIVVLVHSHATIKNTLKSIIAKRLHMVAIPCCVVQEIPNVPFLGYKDTSIWSPKNNVKIWLDLKMKD